MFVCPHASRNYILVRPLFFAHTHARTYTHTHTHTQYYLETKDLHRKISESFLVRGIFWDFRSGVFGEDASPSLVRMPQDQSLFQSLLVRHLKRDFWDWILLVRRLFETGIFWVLCFCLFEQVDVTSSMPRTSGKFTTIYIYVFFILLCMCPDTTIYLAPSCYYICVLILLQVLCSG